MVYTSSAKFARKCQKGILHQFCLVKCEKIVPDFSTLLCLSSFSVYLSSKGVGRKGSFFGFLKLLYFSTLPSLYFVIKGVKKPHRQHPRTIALREIRRYQKSTEFLGSSFDFRSVGNAGKLQDDKSQFVFNQSIIFAFKNVKEVFLLNFCKIFERNDENT